MQSYVEIGGYGFSKSTCESATVWFLNKFLPKHKVHLEINHKGLKREGIFGWCDFIGDHRRPRHFFIELQTYMDRETYLKTLFHELIHIRQWVHGTLRMRRGKMYYRSFKIEDYDYTNQPHEVEAWHEESIVYLQYLSETCKPVEKVAYYFPNRLMM